MESTNSTTEIVQLLSPRNGMHDDAFKVSEQFVFKVKPWIPILSLVILSLASLIGTGGNVLILLAVSTHRKLREGMSAFFINLAVSDLLVTTIADPMSAIGKYTFNSLL